MHREVRFDLFNQFINEMKRLGVEKIAFCETNERRAVQETLDRITVLPVRKLELLAYKDSVLYKCVLDNVDLNATYNLLVSQGFDVSRTSRNIT